MTPPSTYGPWPDVPAAVEHVEALLGTEIEPGNNAIFRPFQPHHEFRGAFWEEARLGLRMELALHQAGIADLSPQSRFLLSLLADLELIQYPALRAGVDRP